MNIHVHLHVCIVVCMYVHLGIFIHGNHTYTSVCLYMVNRTYRPVHLCMHTFLDILLLLSTGRTLRCRLTAAIT